MDFDYDKEEQQFIDELESGQFKIERISNTASDYQEDEESDVTAFKEHMESDDYKHLSSKVFG